MSRSTAYVADTEAILPGAVYPLEAFIKASGITRDRMRRARLAGVDLELLQVGKRKFVEGSKAIRYIFALADLEKSKSD